MGYLFSFINNQKNKKWNHTNLNELTSYFSPKRGSHKFIDILSKEFLCPYPLNYYCLLWIPTHFSKLKLILFISSNHPFLVLSINKGVEKFLQSKKFLFSTIYVYSSNTIVSFVLKHILILKETIIHIYTSVIDYWNLMDYSFIYKKNVTIWLESNQL